jgi:hypothetical protein
MLNGKTHHWFSCVYNTQEERWIITAEKSYDSDTSADWLRQMSCKMRNDGSMPECMIMAVAKDLSGGVVVGVDDFCTHSDQCDLSHFSYARPVNPDNLDHCELFVGTAEHYLAYYFGAGGMPVNVSCLTGVITFGMDEPLEPEERDCSPVHSVGGK